MIIKASLRTPVVKGGDVLVALRLVGEGRAYLIGKGVVVVTGTVIKSLEATVWFNDVRRCYVVKGGAPGQVNITMSPYSRNSACPTAKRWGARAGV